jgi:hypothetical protein
MKRISKLIAWIKAEREASRKRQAILCKILSGR